MKVLEENKKNLVTLLLSVVCIGVLISLIANVIFTELYDVNKKIFIIICCFLLIMFLIILSQMTYRLDRMVYKGSYPIIFSNRELRFIDLPYSPVSVNARVLYDNLSKKQKERIIENKELYQFVDSFVIQYIFSLVFAHSSRRSSIKKWISLDRKYLQEILVKYKYVDVENMLGKAEGSLVLPKGFSIKAATDDNLIISTKQGFIKFSWEISMRKPCQPELFFLSQMKDVDITGCCAYNIGITLEYGYKPLKLFFYSTKELDNYLEACINELSEHDINTILQKAQIEFMTEIIKKLEINTYKESLPVIVVAGKKK